MSSSEKAKAKANDLLAYSQRQVDRVVHPTTRQKAYDYVHDLAIEKPVLFVSLAFIIDYIYSCISLCISLCFYVQAHK